MHETLKRDCLGRSGYLKMERKIPFPNLLFADINGIPDYAEFTVGTPGDLDIRLFPEVRYPASISKLNELEGEGEYGSIYLSGDGVEISHKGAKIYSFPQMVELLGDPVKLSRALIMAREKIGYEPIIYAPAVGRPNHLALLVYYGINLFDSIPLAMASRNGVYLDENGEWHSSLDYNELMEKNYRSALREIEIIRRAIEGRRLRDLVEMRVRSEPWLYAMLRIADEEYWRFFERYEPVRPKKVNYSGAEAIDRPEVMRFRERVVERWRPKGSVLLLLPCSARKPYSLSRTHRKLREILTGIDGWQEVQELIITSPLIAVPRELERYYPAGYYDAAVRGKWDCDEIEAIKEALERIKRLGAFRKVIIHLPEEMDFVSEAIHGEWTSEGSVTSKKSLDNLRSALKDALDTIESRNMRTLWTLQSMVEYQFGIDGEDMVDSVKGRWPGIKGFKDGAQTVMFIPEKASLSLTGEGGKILAEKGAYRVFISDFELHGDVFSIGVEDADLEIREGDDVVIIQKNRAVAVGIAERSADEMVESKRGLAVRVRKKISPSDGPQT